MSPRSGPARLAGERGCGMISANFMPFVNAKTHWETYFEGAERGGIAPDWRKWRLGRSIFVAGSDAEADAYLARPNNSLWTTEERRGWKEGVSKGWFRGVAVNLKKQDK